MRHLLALALLAGAAPAAILYDSGAPMYPFSDVVYSKVLADDFQIMQRADVTGVRYYLWENFAEAIPVATANWWIYGDGSGIPGALLASGTASQTGTVQPGTAMPNPGLNFLMEFSIGPLTLNPGTYWLGLEVPVGTSSTGSTQYTGWYASASGLGARSQQQTTPGSAWFAGVGQAQNYAFQIVGTPVQATAVPEPSTGLLLLAAGCVLGVVRKCI